MRRGYLVPRPDAQRSRWELQLQQPTETFSNLSWEVELRPSDYLLVGGRYGQPERLGHQCFVRGEDVLVTFQGDQTLPAQAPHLSTAAKIYKGGMKARLGR